MAIPKDEIVAFVLKDALKKRPASTQEELGRRLEAVLGKSDPAYSLTGKRAREIAMKTKGVRVTIENREGPMPRKCPCCGGRLKKRHSMNLMGKEILAGLDCVKCPYRGRDGKWVPARYSFKA